MNLLSSKSVTAVVWASLVVLWGLMVFLLQVVHSDRDHRTYYTAQVRTALTPRSHISYWPIVQLCTPKWRCDIISQHIVRQSVMWRPPCAVARAQNTLR